MKIAVPGVNGRMGTIIRAKAATEGVEVVPIGKADVLIDFTRPAATLRQLAQHGGPAVVGTTGFTDTELIELRAFAAQQPVVFAANMSLGVNALLALVRDAASMLAGYDIGIFETHHRHKVDAPSGTALELGKATGRDVTFASLRGGGDVGTHTVMLAADGERIELTHRAFDRGIYASGSLTAARWVLGRPPGLYTMADVLRANRAQEVPR